jgi:hypothetical protein
VQFKNPGASTASYVGWTNGTGLLGQLGVTSGNIMEFYTGAAGTTKVGEVNQAGAWTWGPAGQSDDQAYAHKSNGRFIPGADNTYNNGSISNRWQAVYAVNGTIQTSDARLKQNILPLDSVLSKVNLLRPSKWEAKYSDYKLSNSGFVAQELREVFPEMVMETKETINDVDNILTVSVCGPEMVAVLVKAIQEQQAIIESLKARLEALEAKAP